MGTNGGGANLRGHEHKFKIVLEQKSNLQNSKTYLSKNRPTFGIGTSQGNLFRGEQRKSVDKREQASHPIRASQRNLLDSKETSVDKREQASKAMSVQ